MVWPKTLKVYIWCAFGVASNGKSVKCWCRNSEVDVATATLAIWRTPPMLVRFRLYRDVWFSYVSLWLVYSLPINYHCLDLFKSHDCLITLCGNSTLHLGTYLVCRYFNNATKRMLLWAKNHIPWDQCPVWCQLQSINSLIFSWTLWHITSGIDKWSMSQLYKTSHYVQW